MAVMFLLALGAAGYAMRTSAAAAKARDAAARSRDAEAAARIETEKSLEELKAAQAALDMKTHLAEKSEHEANEAKKAAVIARTKAETEAERANVQAGIARRKEEEARIAAERASIAADAERTAKENAQKLAARLQVGALGRDGLDSLQRGNFGGALYAFQMANEMAKQRSGPADRDLLKMQAWSLSNIGTSQHKLGQHAAAVKSYNEALAIHEKVSGANSPEMFDTLHGLGHAHLDSGDSKKAEEFYTRAVNYLVATPNLIDQLDETPNLEIIARLYRDLGKYAEAEPYFQRVLTNRRESHRVELDELKEVAQFYAIQNKYQQAEPYLLEAIAMQEPTFKDVSDSSELADSYSELGEVYSGQDDELKAKSYFQLARSLQNLALKQRQLDRLLKLGSGDQQDAAKKREALKIDRDLIELGDLFLKVGRLRPAETAYTQAQLQAIETENQTSQADAVMRLGYLYRFDLKEYQKASDRFVEAVALMKGGPQGGSKLLGEALTQLGDLYADELNRPEDAEALLKEALDFVSRSSEPEQATYATLSALADLYRRQQRLPDLVSVSQRKLAVADELLKRNSPNSVAQKAWDAGAYAQAFGLYIQAVSDLSDAFKLQGNVEASNAALGSLLNESLDVQQVVDEKVAEAYAKMLESRKDVLDRLTIKQCDGCPGQPGDPVADRIKGARSKLKQIFQIKRTYVQLGVRG